MKKLLVVLFAVMAIAATSCKKDSETAPSNKVKVSQDKTNVGSWD
jgi:hypothetical protein